MTINLWEAEAKQGRKEILDLKLKVESLKKQITRKSNLHKKTADRLFEKRKQYRELSKKHTELQKRHEYMLQQYSNTFEDGCETELELLKKENEDLKYRLDEATQDASKLHKDNKVLKADVDKAEGKVSCLEQINLEMLYHQGALEEQIGDQQAKALEDHEKNSTLRLENLELKETIVFLSTKLRQLSKSRKES